MIFIQIFFLSTQKIYSDSLDYSMLYCRTFALFVFLHQAPNLYRHLEGLLKLSKRNVREMTVPFHSFSLRVLCNTVIPEFLSSLYVPTADIHVFPDEAGDAGWLINSFILMGK